MDFKTSHDPILTMMNDEFSVLYPIASIHLVIIALVVALAIPGIIFSRKLPRHTFQGIPPLLTRVGSYFIALWTVLWLIQAILTIVALSDDKYLYSPVLSHIRLQVQLIFGIVSSVCMFLVLSFQIAMIDIIGRPSGQEPERLSKWAQGLIFILSPIILISIAQLVIYEVLFESSVDGEGWMKLLRASIILGYISAGILLVTASISLAWLIRSRANIGDYFGPLAIISSLSLIREIAHALFFILTSLLTGAFIGDYPAVGLVSYALSPILTGLTVVVSWNKLLRLFSNYAENDPSSTDGERRPLLGRPEADTVGTVENQSTIIAVFHFIGLAFVSAFHLFLP